MEKKKIWLSQPHMGEDEVKFVMQAFHDNWVAPVGPFIERFENELAAYNNVPYCAALSSGTAAIHLALIILGVSRGDEVICSSFTFAGSCNPVTYEGATPIFVDSESATWNMDPGMLELALKDRTRKGKKPKAIIIVHLYGMPARMEELMSIARAYDVPVIEDAAEALGSTLNGKKLGSFGDLGVYSFNGNKIITTSGGGALVSSNGKWIEKARFLATQARDKAVHYEHTQIGYNYRLSNISAGIGLGQMIVLNERILQRRAVFDRYRKVLKNSNIAFLDEPGGHFSNRWLTTVLIDPAIGSGATRETVRIALQAENIECRPLWKPMHMQPVYKDCPVYENNVSRELFENGLCLPSSSNLLDAEFSRVAETLTKAL